MYTLSELKIALCVLLIINLLIISVIYVVYRRRRRRRKKMLYRRDMQDAYMKHNADFRKKSAEITAEIRRSINAEDNNPAGAYELKKCTDALELLHGGTAAEETLIQDKKSKCNELNISFIDEIHTLPAPEQIEETQVISLMGNLLDNAIEACRSCGAESYIKFSSIIKKNVWIIKVTNSKTAAVNLYESEMKTTKDDVKNHGLGMQIIRKIVSMHNGTINMYDHGNAFETTCLLLFESAKKGLYRR